MPRAGLTKWPWAISIEKLRKSDGGNRNSGHAMSFSGRIPVPIKFGARSRRLPQAGGRFSWLFFTWPIAVVAAWDLHVPGPCGIVVWDGAKPPSQASSSIEQTPFWKARTRCLGCGIVGVGENRGERSRVSVVSVQGQGGGLKQKKSLSKIFYKKAN